MKSKSRFLIIAFILLVAGSVAGGWASRIRSRAANTPSAEMKDNQLVKAFTEGQRLIEDNYAIDRDQETLTRAAVLRMLTKVKKAAQAPR